MSYFPPERKETRNRSISYFTTRYILLEEAADYACVTGRHSATLHRIEGAPTRRHYQLYSPYNDR